VAVSHQSMEHSEQELNTGCPKSRFTEIISCDYQKISNVH
jgi:hypothetical protein